MKAIKVKLYPKPKQAKLFEKHFGCCRVIYNFGLELKTKTYNETKKHLSTRSVEKKLPKLKKEKEWLKEVNSQSLQQSLQDLDSAFSHFFKRNNSFPKYKSRKNPKQSFRVPQHFKITRDQHYIQLPKIGYVRFKDEFNILDSVEFRNITVSREGNEYFASICYDEHKVELKLKKIEENKTLGIDLGITSLMAFSNGTKLENPKHLKQYEDKLALEQQKLSKKTNKETNSYKRQKHEVYKVHKKIRNIRKDFLHKITTKLVENQDYTSYCMEDLAVKEMQEKEPTPMARAIGDAGWRMARTMMDYKCKDKGKNFIVIGRFDASSKTCHMCGNIYHELKREEKKWKCKKCGEVHDRDLNASQNIKNFGLVKSLGKSFVERLEPHDL
jgi:putative transposase